MFGAYHNLHSTDSRQFNAGEPFMFCSILLTTAKLFVTPENMSITDIENASDISDFSKNVPYLHYTYNSGQEFRKYCKKVFGSLNIEEFIGKIKEFEAISKKLIERNPIRVI